MPMYFFDVQEQDGTVTRDVVGVELASDNDALDTASQTLLDAVHDTGFQHADLKLQVIVRNNSGLVIGRRHVQLSRSDEAN